MDLDWPAPATVVVHRGETLWSIAARQLGPDATDAQIDTAWHHWYTANREVIGDNPDVILPGQQLHAPPAQTDRPHLSSAGRCRHPTIHRRRAR
ncbi:MAG: LysM peptidoglycan-binding domain-containing protein [Nakamurella sp.]